jgi:Ca2+-binding RTX toxin-like protein
MRINKKAVAADFLKAATEISDAVDKGASPQEQSVVDTLNKIVADFNPAFTAGTDSFDFLFSKKADLNYVNGLGGNDVMFGGKKTDVLVGGSGDDVMFGLGGDDGLFGGAGNDVMFGGEGADILRGGAGNDRMFGDHGKDELTGGVGDDILSGGAGADRFMFNPNRPGEGADRIVDFNASQDKIVLSVTDVLASTPGLVALAGDLNAFGADDLDASDLWNLSASADGDVVISHPNGTIELDGFKFDANLKFGDLLPAIDLIA